MGYLGGVRAEIGEMAARWRDDLGVSASRIDTLVFQRLCERRGLMPDGAADDEPQTSGEIAVLAALREPLPWPRQEDEASLLGTLHERRRTDRRARGAYYTPKFIADYIAQTALGPGTVVDPACGGGAFCVAALRALRRRHPRTSPERLLQERIFAIDVDREAVEVTRRCLLLELGVPLADAPDLARNLTCADALTEWRGSGFGAVIGNPPYQRERGAKALLDGVVPSAIGQAHRTARMDYWHYFLHRGLAALRPGGRLSFIVSSYWMGGAGAGGVVDAIADLQIEELFDLGSMPVFAGLQGRHVILTVRKRRSHAPVRIKHVAETGFEDAVATLVPQAELIDGRRVVLPGADSTDFASVDFTASPTLDSVAVVRQGIAENPATINGRTNRRFDERWSVGQGVFVLTDDERAQLDLSEAERALLRPYLAVGDVARWRLRPPSRWLIYATAETWPRLEDAPKLAAHLEQFQPVMSARRETRNGHRRWWHLHWPRDPELLSRPKIVAPQMVAEPAFAVVDSDVLASLSTNLISLPEGAQLSLHALAAILSSRLIGRWFARHSKRRGVGLDIGGGVLRRVPMPEMKGDLLRTCDRLARARVNGDDALDAEIEAIVGRLYGLQPAR